MTFVPGSSIAGILLSNTFCCKFVMLPLLQLTSKLSRIYEVDTGTSIKTEESSGRWNFTWRFWGLLIP